MRKIMIGLLTLSSMSANAFESEKRFESHFQCPSMITLQPKGTGNWKTSGGVYDAPIKGAKVQTIPIGTHPRQWLICNYGTIGQDPVQLSQEHEGKCTVNQTSFTCVP